MSKQGVNNVLTNRCKCCLRERPSKELWSEHCSQDDAEAESYGAMITSCFQLFWSEPDSETERICYPCIGRLRDAHYFKTQVLEAQQFMSEMMDEDETDVEQKIEDFLEKHHFATNSQDILIIKPEADDISIGSYTELEYLEVDNDDRSGNESVLIKSDNEKKSRVQSTTDTVLVGETVIKKVKTKSSPTPETRRSNRLSIKPKIQKPEKKNLEIVEKGIEKKKYTNVPKKPEENRNIMNQVERIKHQDNLVALLLSTNATPIHKQQDTGFECGFCSQIYQIPADLKQHIIQDHTDDEKDKYMAERELYRFLVKLDITDLQCNHCGMPLHDLESAWEHLQTHSVTVHLGMKNQLIPYKFEREPFHCFICDTEFAHFRALTLHMSTHLPNYICPTCGRGYLTNRSMLLHSRMHGDGKFMCSYCPKEFSVRHLWKMHERKKHVRRQNPTNVCGFCGERFNDHIKKYRHMEKEHGVKRTMYECDICNKHLACKKTLKNHVLNVHHRLKQFQCPICDKECYDKTNMARHVQTHSKKSNKNKGMRCDYCPKLFNREASLKLHQRAHISDAHHICEMCSEVFLMKSGLLSHLRAKHGVHDDTDIGTTEEHDI